jgi:hypothetical protein
MTHLTDRPAMKKTLLVSLAIFTVFCSLATSFANASVNEWEGKNLPGHTWTTGNGVVQPKLVIAQAWAQTTSSVCTGPVTHDATGFHFPYGWSCSPEAVYWYFSAPIAASVGLYNPNGGTFQRYWAHGVSE